MAKDPARKWTDKELKEMEQHIGNIYDQALTEITEKWDAYMAKSAKRLDKLHEAYEKAPADKKEDALKAYQDALRNVTFKDKYYHDMVKETATRLCYTNKVATAYMNEQIPQVYKVNYDQIDPDAVIPGIKYTMVSEETIANLIKDGTIPQRDLDERKDKTWNTKQIGSTVLQGILQGESIKDMSKRLLPIVNKNEASAVRNARTMTTCAENRGRLDRYADYESKGLIMKKVWIATGDSRTRDWHLSLGGQEVDKDEPFVDGNGNELMYPGDPDAAPETVWNCRCSMRSHITGVRGKSGKITPIADMHQKGLHQEQIEAERKRRGIETKPTTAVAKDKGPAFIFKPANTIDEAERYLKDVLGLSTSDFGKVNINYANMLNETLTDYYNTFGDLHKLGVLDEIRIVPKLSSVAGYQPQMKTVLLKKGDVSTKNAIAKSLKEAKEQHNFGWWATGTEKTVVSHELGHAVHHALTTDSIYDHKNSKIETLLVETRKQLGVDPWKGSNEDLDKIKKCGEVLSYYGLRNSKEFVAEAVCEYMTSDSPREISKKIYKILMGE